MSFLTSAKPSDCRKGQQIFSSRVILSKFHMLGLLKMEGMGAVYF